MQESERSDEQRYFPSVGAVLFPLSIPLALMFVISVLRMLRHGVDVSLLLAHVLKYVCGLVLYVLFMRAICVVRLSRAGIRGSSRTLTSWTEITQVAVHRNLFISGFYVRSAHKRSIWIHRSVWSNPAFARHVDVLAASSALHRALVTDRALARVAQAQDRGDS